MNQYEYEVRNKRTGGGDVVRVTAPNRHIARAVAVEEYGDSYEVAAEPRATRPAHAVVGEIDATNPDYTQRVLDMAAKAFGVSA